MFKKLMAGFAALWWSTLLLAAVDVNQASVADLGTIKGIGPAISSRIIEERKLAPFNDWADLVQRVKGIGEPTAAKFSAEGLTVNGARYGATPAPAKSEPARNAKDGKAPKETAAKPAKDQNTKPAAPAKASAPS